MKSEHQQVSCSDSVSEMTGRRQAGSQSAIKKLCGASIPYQEFPIPYIEVVIEITLLPVYPVCCTLLYYSGNWYLHNMYVSCVESYYLVKRIIRLGLQIILFYV